MTPNRSQRFWKKRRENRMNRRKFLFIRDDKQVPQLDQEIRRLFYVLIMINEQNTQELLILDEQRILLHQLIPFKIKNK
jgi:hypothetical protein